MKEIEKLLEQRRKLWEENKKLLAQAEADSRDFTPEEKQEWDKRDTEIDSLGERAERMSRADKVEKSFEERMDSGIRPTIDKGDDGENRDNEDGDKEQATAKWSDAFRAWALCNTDRCKPEFVEAAKSLGWNPTSKSYDFRLNSTPPMNLHDAREKRAQSVGTTTAGGFSVPDELMAAIEVSLLQFGGMREVSTVIRTESGADMPIPTVNDTAQVGAILAENTGVSEQDVTFGQIVLQAYKYSSKMVKVSVELLQDSSVDIASLLGRLLGERVARITNTHFTTGTGTAQPNGVVTASSSGLTGQTLKVGVPQYSEFVDLIHSVDPAYRAGPGVALMMSDAGVKEARKLVDGNALPIWQPGMAVGQPSAILGHPVIVNQDVADPALNAKSVVFGDFSKYWIRDTLPFTLLRLDERFADAHQVAFLLFSRHDGDLMDAGTDPIKFFTGAAT